MGVSPSASVSNCCAALAPRSAPGLFTGFARAGMSTSTVDDLKDRIDDLNDKFVEARDEIELAQDVSLSSAAPATSLHPVF